MFQNTKNYINSRKENRNDLKKVLEAETKYKLSYFQYQDCKVTTMDLENVVEESRNTIKQIQKDIKIKFKDLKKESDSVFEQVLQIISKFFTDFDPN